MKSIFRRLTGKSTRAQSAAAPVDNPSVVELENLEPRLLFSAAPVETPAETETAGEPQAAEEAAVVTAQAAQETAVAVESAESTQESRAANLTVAGQTEVPADRGVNLVNLNPGVEEVHRETLEAVADAAADRWRATGLTAEQSAALENIQYVVEDLGGPHLGFAEGMRITIDDNAAGNLWFIDHTPMVDEEYTTVGESGTLFTANGGTLAAGKTDLLTVIMHEQGNILGLEDSNSGADDLMLGALGYNYRVLPAEGQAGGAVLGSVESSYLDSGVAGSGADIENRQPFLGVNYAITLQGIFPTESFGAPVKGGGEGFSEGTSYIGEIQIFGGNFAPVGTSLAQGQILSISSNTALFSILGTTYGGDGQSTFALPDLRGRTPIGVGTGPGLDPVLLGQKSGDEMVNLAANQIPVHGHTGLEDTTAGGQSHTNAMPTLGLNYIVSTQGTYPLGLGKMGLFAGNFAPAGTEIADGQLLQISSFNALFSLLGTSYGGDGESTFALPDLRGRVAVNAGNGTATGGLNLSLGEQAGQATNTVTTANLPSHTHTLPTGDSGATGDGVAYTNAQPTLAVTYMVQTSGIFPSEEFVAIENFGGGGGSGASFDSTTLGGIFMHAARENTLTSIVGGSIADANGTLISISSNNALFSIFGTTFGGDGNTTFGLPDLRGRAAVGTGQLNGNGTNYTLGQTGGSATTTLTVAQMAAHSHVVPAPADSTAPTVTSIVRQNPTDATTNADQVTFRVTFDEDVQNVDVADFVLSGTAAGDGTVGAPSVVTSSSVYDVTITGLTNSNGTINLDFAGGQNIEDLAGNALANTTPGSENDFTLDNTAPTVTSILRETPMVATTNADQVTFRVTFDEDVQNVDVADFALSGTAAGDGTIGAPSAVTGTSVYDVVVTGLTSSDGTINLDFAGGQNIEDLAGNALANTSPGSENDFTLDNTATVAITEPISTDGSINAAEDGSVSVAGTTAGIEDGRTVTISVSDGSNPAVTGTASVSSNAFTVAGLDLSGLDEGSLTFSASVSDLAGNAATDTATAVLDQTATVAITEPISTDGLINASEDDSVSVAGTTAGIEDGRTVTISASDGSNPAVTGTASVSSNAFSVAGLDLSGLDDGSLTFSASVSDLAGNAATDTANAVLDKIATVAITEPISTDGLINAAEDDSVSVAGTTAGIEDGRTVTISASDGSNPAVTGTASVSSNAFSVAGLDLSGLDEGSLTFSASVSDLAGNSATDTATAVLDKTATVAITEPISTDGLINAAEDDSVSVAGTTAGIEDGRTVTISVSDGSNPAVTGTASVSSNAFTVTALDLSGLDEGSLTFSASVSDLAGNAATDTANAVLDRTATIAITEPISADGLINAAEDDSVSVAGTTSGIEDGRTVTISASDGSNPAVTGTASVSSNAFTVAGLDLSSLDEGSLTFSASVSDLAGNAASDTATAVLDQTGTTPGITGPPGPLPDLNPFDVTIAFGEPVSGFLQSEITVGNGSVTGFTDNTGGSFTVQITPTAAGNVTVDVNAGVANDPAGNGNTAAAQFSVTITGAPAGDNSASVTGTDLTILADGDGDTVTLSSDGITLKIESGDDSIVGGSGTTNSNGDVLVPIGGLTSITIDAGGDNDTINITSLDGFTGSLDIMGGDGQDFIQFKADVTLDPGNNANLSAEEIELVNAGIETTGDGLIDIAGTGGGTGSFPGVDLNGSTLEASGTGSISVTGQGGDDGSSSLGIKLANSSSISTASGNIELIGTGGGDASANIGVAIYTGSSIAAGGAGMLTITGSTSGGGTLNNDGVKFATGTSASVVDGNMVITGTSGGSGNNNRGINLASGVMLTGTGMGNLSLNGSSTGSGTHANGVYGSNAQIDTTAGTGTVTINGTGSTNGNGSSAGVRFIDGGVLTGGDGGIDIDGVGGDSGTNNRGISLEGGIALSTAGSGAITLDGTGGNGTSFNDGVTILGGSSVSSVNAAVTIQGTGKGTTNKNRGIQLTGTVQSTGNGTVTLRGTGSTAAGGSYNHGIYAKGSTIGANTGNLIIAGLGGTGTTGNAGVHLQTSGATTNGLLTLTGSANAGTTTTNNHGVYIYQNTTVDGGAGSTITGTGGGGTKFNHGVVMKTDISSNLDLGNIMGTPGAGSPSDDLNGDFF